MKVATDNPYKAPQCLTSDILASQKRVSTFAALLILLILMWVGRVCLLFVPNNQLHSIGLGNAIALDFTLGSLLALVIAFGSLGFRRNCPSVLLMGAIQLLSWTYSVGWWLFLVSVGILLASRGI